MKARSSYAAPLLPGRNLPVILISHGWQGYRDLHTDLAEELASRGYLVAAADHTYGAAAVVFDDGQIISSEPRILPRREESNRFLDHASRLVTTFAEDNRFILDHLDLVNRGKSSQGPPELARFDGRVDMERIGVAGHSTGGGAMVQLALDDPRVDAVLGLDAWVEPVGAERLAGAAASESKVPMLFLRSQTWEGGINDGFLVPFAASLGDSARLYQIDGTTHEQFTMLYMYAPVVKWLGMLGDTDPKAFARFLSASTAAFFDETLKGAPPALPDYPGLKKMEE
jgi:dienelactone hydrolase